jgi:hypothetical protein
MAFFARWFYEQTDDMQDRVRTLVANKQLSFANGGWCMHDEVRGCSLVKMIGKVTFVHQLYFFVQNNF